MDFVNDKKCVIEGCNNLGEWDCIKRNKLYRRKLCSTHRIRLKRQRSVLGARTYAKEIFKRDSCKFCEYCGWEGPCDCHRPNIGKYKIGNMRSACPNCHRLISRGLLIDKFKTTTII
jgi:hypothetical protein